MVCEREYLIGDLVTVDGMRGVVIDAKKRDDEMEYLIAFENGEDRSVSESKASVTGDR